MDVAIEALSLLGADKFLKTRDHSLGEVWRQVQHGLPIESFDSVVHHVPKQERARWRKMVTQNSELRLSEDDSAKVARLAYTLALSKEVWGSWHSANEFLKRPHPALDGKTSYEAIESEWDARQLERILRSIQFGLPA